MFVILDLGRCACPVLTVHNCISEFSVRYIFKHLDGVFCCKFLTLEGYVS
jgi:hypothetical protein